MRILWFEVTEPSAYKTGGAPIGGWQDSLERIVKTIPDIELTITFISEEDKEEKVVNGVTYIPMFVRWTQKERHSLNYWDLYLQKMLPCAKEVIEKATPDLIQVFGTEWLFGQVTTFTNIPVVIHIMGAIIPYNNAWYPPGYSYESQIIKNWWNPLAWYRQICGERKRKDWSVWEEKTWSLISNYMGRTGWDESLSRIMHPGRNYYHVEEALRDIFLTGNNKWSMPEDNKIRLVSTGCKTYWKGPDMMLKVAYLLSNQGLDFEWVVIGQMDRRVKLSVENKLGIKFENCNVRVLGYKQPDELLQILCHSTMYVHTAYIENSPNSICEAQCLGVPVVSTNVGGISTLIRNDIDGVLVPANDPWQMTDAIIQLAKDKDRMARYSESSRKFALKRHNDENIKEQLMECYKALVR